MPQQQWTGNDKLNKFRGNWRLAGAALIFYGLLAFLILHPILFATGTRVAGFDYFNYHWNFWWLRFAPSTPGLSVYETNFTMFPYTTNLGYHALTAFWYPLWALIEPLVGTLAAMNVIIYVACVLNGILLFLLLRREGASAAAALMGGAALQAAPTLRYFYYNTHINLMDWFWLPALLLIWSEITHAVNRKQWRAMVIAIGFGFAIWGLTLTDLQFPIFAAFLLVPYGLLTLWRSKRRAALIACGIVGIAVGFALLWFAGPFPHILEFEGTLAPGIVEDRPGIPLPAGFLRMSDTWWEWSAPSAGAWITVAIALGVIAGWLTRRRLRWRAWFWFALMLPPLIFALGPTLIVGDLEIPLPFRVLHALTNGMFRMPWRLLPIAIVAATLFAALALKPILARRRNALPWFVSAALLLLVADVRLFESAPLTPVPTDYQIYRTIREETGPGYDDEVIIEIPTGAASGEVIFGDSRATQLQWYTIVHQKRIVNGFISRAPLEHFYYLEIDDPMLSWLGQRRYLEPATVERQMRERVETWKIGYFILHRDLIGRDTPAVQEIISFFNSLDDLLCPHSVEGDIVAYRTRRHPDGCLPRTPALDDSGAFAIDVGSEADVRHVGTGWYYAENVFDVTLRWAGEQPGAVLYADLPPGDYVVQVEAQAYFEPRTRGADRQRRRRRGLGRTSARCNTDARVSYPGRGDRQRAACEPGPHL
ncbi:MAG: hypothetical protein IPK19_33305 [Chloroflexi bacterium]|nr:hypothetical protein [Chloroflexota bacterium]